MGLHNSIPTLPPELRDLIVDQLRDDKTTLAECSLVSLGWLNRSRYHLFASVQVADSHDRLHFKAFGHFVGATSSIWKYVRRLRLRGIADEDRTSKLDIQTLAFILNKLFRLHTLELVELVLCASSKPGPPLLPRHMCKVTLDVVSSDSGYRRLVDFLHLFSTIDTFHVLLVGEDIYEDTLSAPMPLNLQISTLVLDAKNPNRPVIEILRRTPTMKTIKSLKAVVEDFPDPKHIGAFLLDIGQTLTDLELHVSTDIEGEESPCKRSSLRPFGLNPDSLFALLRCSEVLDRYATVVLCCSSQTPPPSSVVNLPSLAKLVLLVITGTIHY